MTFIRQHDSPGLNIRRQNWTTRRWRVSEHGNAFLNVRGFNIVVFGSRKGWGIKIEQRYGERCQFGKRRYPTCAEAKAAAFEALMWAEQKWGGNGRYGELDGRSTQAGG